MILRLKLTSPFVNFFYKLYFFHCIEFTNEIIIKNFYCKKYFVLLRNLEKKKRIEKKIL